MRVGMGVVLSLAFGSCAMAFENEYPRGDLLLEPGTLAKPEIARQFVVLDARPRVQYDEGHIPGAVWVDAAAWAKAFGGPDSTGSPACFQPLQLPFKSRASSTPQYFKIHQIRAASFNRTLS